MSDVSSHSPAEQVNSPVLNSSEGCDIPKTDPVDLELLEGMLEAAHGGDVQSIIGALGMALHCSVPEWREINREHPGTLVELQSIHADLMRVLVTTSNAMAAINTGPEIVTAFGTRTSPIPMAASHQRYDDLSAARRRELDNMITADNMIGMPDCGVSDYE